MSQLVCRHGGGIGYDVSGNPTVSVLVAVRNEETHLRECLHGLMDQSIADRIEVIVVDHASQQSEWAIVADLQKRHKNIIAIRAAGVPGSTAYAWNLAGKIARGSYLMVLEAADRLRSDALEILAAGLDANTGTALVYGDTCFTAIPHQSFENHTSFGKMIWPDYTVQQLSQLSLVAPHPMWRREVHDEIGWFNETDHSHVLHDFLLRVVRHHHTMHLEIFTGLKLVAAESGISGACDDIPLPLAAATRAVEAAPPEQAPESAEDIYAAVQEALDEGDDQRAAEMLRHFLQTHPHHATAHNDLAALSYRLGQVDDALSHYQTAVELAPKETTFRKNLADLYFVELGRTDEAITIYLELLKDAPRDVETLLNLGIISEGIGHPGEAESFYERGLEIEPWNPVLRQRLTELRAPQAPPAEIEESPQERYARVEKMVAAGRLAEATAELERILSSCPDFAVAHNDLAVLSYQNGEKDKALEHYEKAAQLAPGNSVFQKNLADFYFLEGKDVDGAIAIYLEELRKDPRNVETLLSLGKICVMLERGEEARTFYGKALELEPWNREARERLSEL